MSARRLCCAIALLTLVAVAVPIHAAEAPLTLQLSGGSGSTLAQPLRIVLLLTVLALLPAIVIAMTSFTRSSERQAPAQLPGPFFRRTPYELR